MSLPATIAPAILDTVIGRLAVLFLTGAAGDMNAAREAGRQMLAAHNAETLGELTLAAEVISLQLHTLEALSYAADPQLSLNNILRLRGSAVSLSRESHKAQRKLDQLQAARRAGTTAPTTEVPTPTRPAVGNALELIETARDAIQIAAKTGGKSWTQAFQERLTAKRVAKKLTKKQAQQANLPAHFNPAPASAHAAAPTA
jgi:RNA 3'-terminal phosphate cyclase